MIPEIDKYENWKLGYESANRILTGVFKNDFLIGFITGFILIIVIIIIVWAFLS